MSTPRNTQQLPSNIARNVKERKYLSYVQMDRDFDEKLSKQPIYNMKKYIESDYIVRDFLDQVLMSQLQRELQKRQMKKIVRQTIDHCENLVNYQNWQINPVAPFNVKLNQSTIRLDQEPKIKLFDPLLGFDKKMTYKQMKVQAQFSNSISMSRFKNTLWKQKKLGNLKPNESSKSIIINRSLSSRKSTTITHLIPLRLESDIISEISPKRNLQDFLRDKKLNKQYGMGINLGQRLHGMFQEKQNDLKTIKQFQKTPNFNKTSKNLIFQVSLPTKLPILLFKDEFATDYNGQSIQLKKQSKIKRGVEVLKTGFKIIENVESSRSERKLKTKIQIIKLKPLGKSKQQVDLTRLSARMSARRSAQNNLQEKIEQSLIKNRVLFRQLDENESLFNVEPQRHVESSALKTAEGIYVRMKPSISKSNIKNQRPNLQA